VTSQSPAGADDPRQPREIVDELEEKVSGDAGPEGATPDDGAGSTDPQGDVEPTVPGSPEPTD
jgi:hypothetical protein